VAQDVLCEVVNCKFNRNGRKCGADEIFVGAITGKKASTNEETDCKTFEPE
jgi:hypothetical protein